MTSAKKNRMSIKCEGCKCYICNLQNIEQCCGPCWDCEEQSEIVEECYLYADKK
jgi:hypothetical protein